MKYLIDIKLQTFNKSKRTSREKYLLAASIGDTDIPRIEGVDSNIPGIMIRGNDLEQLVWWVEWKLSHDLTDGEVNMDVQ